MLYVIILSLIVGALGFYFYFLKDTNYFKKHGIPHVRPLYIFGNMAGTLFRRESMAELVKKIYDVHPDAKYVGMYDFTKPVIVLRDPEIIKIIAIKHFDLFPDRRTFDSDYEDPIISKNLFALSGERWRKVRALLSPAFTSSKMKNMFKLMSECGVDFATFLAQLPPEKKMMDMKDVFTRYTNDVIATCAFGLSVDSMRNPQNQFYMYVKESMTFSIVAFLKIFILKILPWLAQMLEMRLLPARITNFFHDVIENTIKTRDEKGIVRPDLLQLLMENKDKDGKPELSIDDMVAQAFIFFFGGFDSTSTLMCFAAHEIAVNRNVYERLQKEIDQVLENTNGEVTYDIINNMEYLDAVINEALRMYPAGVMTDRSCIKDFELPPTLPGKKPFTVKNGQIVWIPIYGIQRDPKYFENPERFNPERFIGERKKHSLSCGAFLPFGLGPRMCIGNRFALLETKVLFFHLLACCDLKPCEKTAVPLRIAKDNFNMKAEGGFWLNVVPRKSVQTVPTVTTN